MAEDLDIRIVVPERRPWDHPERLITSEDKKDPLIKKYLDDLRTRFRDGLLPAYLPDNYYELIDRETPEDALRVVNRVCRFIDDYSLNGQSTERYSIKALSRLQLKMKTLELEVKLLEKNPENRTKKIEHLWKVLSNLDPRIRNSAFFLSENYLFSPDKWYPRLCSGTTFNWLIVILRNIPKKYFSNPMAEEKENVNNIVNFIKYLTQNIYKQDSIEGLSLRAVLCFWGQPYNSGDSFDVIEAKLLKVQSSLEPQGYETIDGAKNTLQLKTNKEGELRVFLNNRDFNSIKEAQKFTGVREIYQYSTVMELEEKYNEALVKQFALYEIYHRNIMYKCSEGKFAEARQYLNKIREVNKKELVITNVLLEQLKNIINYEKFLTSKDAENLKKNISEAEIKYPRLDEKNKVTKESAIKMMKDKVWGELLWKELINKGYIKIVESTDVAVVTEKFNPEHSLEIDQKFEFYEKSIINFLRNIHSEKTYRAQLKNDKQGYVFSEMLQKSTLNHILGQDDDYKKYQVLLKEYADKSNPRMKEVELSCIESDLAIYQFNKIKDKDKALDILNKSIKEKIEGKNFESMDIRFLLCALNYFQANENYLQTRNIAKILSEKRKDFLGVQDNITINEIMMNASYQKATYFPRKVINSISDMFKTETTVGEDNRKINNKDLVKPAFDYANEVIKTCEGMKTDIPLLSSRQVMNAYRVKAEILTKEYSRNKKVKQLKEALELFIKSKNIYDSVIAESNKTIEDTNLYYGVINNILNVQYEIIKLENPKKLADFISGKQKEINELNLKPGSNNDELKKVKLNFAYIKVRYYTDIRQYESANKLLEYLTKGTPNVPETDSYLKNFLEPGDLKLIDVLRMKLNQAYILKEKGDINAYKIAESVVKAFDDGKVEIESNDDKKIYLEVLILLVKLEQNMKEESNQKNKYFNMLTKIIDSKQQMEYIKENFGMFFEIYESLINGILDQDNEDCIEKAREFINKITPANSADYYSLLMKFYSRAEEPQKAIEAANNILRDGTPEQKFWANLTKAYAYIKLKDSKNADESYRTTLNSIGALPAESLYAKELAKLQMSYFAYNNHYQEAINSADRALSINGIEFKPGELDDIKIQKAYALIGIMKYPEARKLGLEVLKGNESSAASAVLNMINSKDLKVTEKKNLVKAFKLLADQELEDDKQGTAYLEKMADLMNNKNFVEFLKKYKLVPENYFLLIGNYYIKKENIPKAEEYLKSLSGNGFKEQPEFALMQGNLELLKKNHYQAKQVFEKILAKAGAENSTVKMKPQIEFFIRLGLLRACNDLNIEDPKENAARLDALKKAVPKHELQFEMFSIINDLQTEKYFDPNDKNEKADIDNKNKNAKAVAAYGKIKELLRNISKGEIKITEEALTDLDLYEGFALNGKPDYSKAIEKFNELVNKLGEQRKSPKNGEQKKLTRQYIDAVTGLVVAKIGDKKYVSAEEINGMLRDDLIPVNQNEVLRKAEKNIKLESNEEEALYMLQQRQKLKIMAYFAAGYMNEALKLLEGKELQKYKYTDQDLMELKLTRAKILNEKDNSMESRKIIYSEVADIQSKLEGKGYKSSPNAKVSELEAKVSVALKNLQTKADLTAIDKLFVDLIKNLQNPDYSKEKKTGTKYQLSVTNAFRIVESYIRYIMETRQFDKARNLQAVLNMNKNIKVNTDSLEALIADIYLDKTKICKLEDKTGLCGIIQKLPVFLASDPSAKTSLEQAIKEEVNLLEVNNASKAKSSNYEEHSVKMQKLSSLRKSQLLAEAIKYIQETLIPEKKSDVTPRGKSELAEYYGQLAEIYIEQKDFDKAAQAITEVKKLTDVIKDEYKSEIKNLAALQFRYNTAKGKEPLNLVSQQDMESLYADDKKEYALRKDIIETQAKALKANKYKQEDINRLSASYNALPLMLQLRVREEFMGIMINAKTKEMNTQGIKVEPQNYQQALQYLIGTAAKSDNRILILRKILSIFERGNEHKPINPNAYSLVKAQIYSEIFWQQLKDKNIAGMNDALQMLTIIESQSRENYPNLRQDLDKLFETYSTAFRKSEDYDKLRDVPEVRDYITPLIKKYEFKPSTQGSDTYMISFAYNKLKEAETKLLDVIPLNFNKNEYAKIRERFKAGDTIIEFNADVVNQLMYSQEIFGKPQDSGKQPFKITMNRNHIIIAYRDGTTETIPNPLGKAGFVRAELNWIYKLPYLANAQMQLGVKSTQSFTADENQALKNMGGVVRNVTLEAKLSKYFESTKTNLEFLFNYMPQDTRLIGVIVTDTTGNRAQSIFDQGKKTATQTSISQDIGDFNLSANARLETPHDKNYKDTFAHRWAIKYKDFFEVYQMTMKGMNVTHVGTKTYDNRKVTGANLSIPIGKNVKLYIEGLNVKNKVTQEQTLDDISGKKLGVGLQYEKKLDADNKFTAGVKAFWFKPKGDEYLVDKKVIGAEVYAALKKDIGKFINSILNSQPEIYFMVDINANPEHKDLYNQLLNNGLLKAKGDKLVWASEKDVEKKLEDLRKKTNNHALCLKVRQIYYDNKFSMYMSTLNLKNDQKILLDIYCKSMDKIFAGKSDLSGSSLQIKENMLKNFYKTFFDRINTSLQKINLNLEGNYQYISNKNIVQTRNLLNAGAGIMAQLDILGVNFMLSLGYQFNTLAQKGMPDLGVYAQWEKQLSPETKLEVEAGIDMFNAYFDVSVRHDIGKPGAFYLRGGTKAEVIYRTKDEQKEYSAGVSATKGVIVKLSDVKWGGKVIEINVPLWMLPLTFILLPFRIR
ncbi:MAG: hypothetical protein PHV30_08275, partial [Candidatus Margulisbacteria bacterium]|nr:hypothetical protein [Candidatus Margulisiibacteriota bacterium]